MTRRVWPALAVLLVGCGAAKAPGPKPEVMDGPPPWMTRGEEVRLDVAEQLLDQKNTRGALEIVRGMRQEGYDSGELDLLQGRALRIDGLVDDSERLLLEADRKLKRDARPSTELCVLLADAGRVDEAVAHCQRATEYDPTSSQAWNNLGFLLLVAERPTEALAASAKAVELDSTNALFRNNLALAQAAAGRHEAAYQTYQSTLPRAVAAYNVGAALERFDDPDHALVYYERAIDFDPTHADAVAALARLNDARPAGDSDTPPPGDTP